MACVDVWYPQGTYIRATAEQLRELEDYFANQTTASGVQYVASTIGQGGPRFTLTYMVEKVYESYAQLIIRTETTAQMRTVLRSEERRVGKECRCRWSR